MNEAAQESARWLEWLYGPEPVGPIWIGGHGDGFRGRLFTTIEEAVLYGQELDQKRAGGVYHRLTTMHDVAEGRGAAGDSTYLPAFAMDLDLRGPGHVALNYPESEQDLRSLLRRAGLPEPSVWVHSGGGRYPFWKLDNAADLTLPGELERAAGISSDLHQLVIEWAKDAGLKVDNTRDLARVYRLPGTHNRKGGGEVMARALWSSHEHPSDPVSYSLAEMRTSVERAPRAPGGRAVTPSGPPAPTTASRLFAAAEITDGPRLYSITEAMDYVQPALDALRAASDGEINNRLNDAAVRMAHFGEEFWSREAAERQLLDALSSTAYDGATWQAEQTIASAYNALATKSGPEYWRAEKRASVAEAVEAANPDDVQALLGEMLTPSQIKARPRKQYLIKGLLHLNTETWLIGAPGSRKSFVALDLAAHIAEGLEWQGLRVKQGKVIIVAAEGAGGIGDRIAAWEKEHGRPMSEDVIVLNRPIQAASPAQWAVLVRAAARLEPVFMVLDTQARVTVGLEENSATDMGRFIDAVGALRSASGACVMVVHHTGRTGGDARGSSALDGAQDTELKVISKAEPLRGELRVEKQKDLPQREPLPLVFASHWVGQDEDGDPITSLALRAPSAWSEAEMEAPADADPASAVQIQEPQSWTTALVSAAAGPVFVVRRQLLQAFADLGDPMGEGFTSAEMRAVVAERWYQDRPAAEGRTRRGVDSQTWRKAWDGAVALSSASGDKVLMDGRGMRKVLNPDVTGE